MVSPANVDASAKHGEITLGVRLALALMIDLHREYRPAFAIHARGIVRAVLAHVNVAAAAKRARQQFHWNLGVSDDNRHGHFSFGIINRPDGRE
jgi:hypothetical protein